MSESSNTSQVTAPPPGNFSPAPATASIPKEFNVAAASAAWWTAVWVAALSIYAIAPYFFDAYSYDTYKTVRNLAILVLAVLAVIGIGTAWKYIGGKKDDLPWYTNGLLVALLIFWAICPPTWFFLEYYLFDTEAIKLPESVKREDFLKQVKTYADLGSKIWAATGAALGAAVAAARK